MADENEMTNSVIRSNDLEGQANGRAAGDSTSKPTGNCAKNNPVGFCAGFEPEYCDDSSDRYNRQEHTGVSGNASDSRYVPQPRYENRRGEPFRAAQDARNMQETLDGINMLVGQLRHDPYDQRRPNAGHAKPKVMPDLFDGRVAWSQYKAHFNTVAELNDWNEHEKAQYLAVSLRGEACQVVELLEPALRQNYRQLVEAMDRRFHPNHSESLYRTQLRTRTRRAKESLPQLAQAIRALARQAYPTADHQLLDSLCGDHFIEALQDDEMKMRLIGGNVERFDDLVSQAIKYEAWSESCKMKPGRRYVSEIHRDDTSVMDAMDDQPAKGCNALQGIKNTDMTEVNQKLKILQDLLNELLGKTDRKKPVQCFYCHEAGHIRPNCPKLTGDKKFSPGTKKLNSN